MYIIPLIRCNRAIVATFIYPNHPIIAISISEIISVIAPILNPNTLKKINGLILTIIYAPTFSHAIFNIYKNDNINKNKTELLLLIIFIFTNLIIY